ncbi:MULTISPECIES: glycosyltransferase 87 family protein [unclassified Streptomyces]|uniref:glycosyltransferase 87 family protein n=1 Tax=unclassified Streptomyces TaxID=2593676 RepID=UPI0020952FF7|nr:MULTISPECIES: glycosyltransferase 87 family protein [unclassified Streptomyces]
MKWGAGWAGAGVWAAGFAAFSSLTPHRVWGASAAVGYVGAALAAGLLRGPRARPAALGSALTGAVMVPFGYLLLTGAGQSEVGVIQRSAVLLLHSGTPYLAEPQAVTDYNPYLPGMALFGVPAALLGDGSPVARLLGDARLWCAVVLVVCLVGGRAVLRRGGPGRVAAPGGSTGPAVLVASPLVAFPLCVSGVDLPLAGLCWLGLALAARGRAGAAGLALAAACALKWTALPAVAVAAALLAGSHGGRQALRCASAWSAGFLALVLPAVLLSPGPLVEQVLAFPTGRAEVATPAASPLPGRLLAELGPAGWYTSVLLLVCGGVAVAVSLVTRPPAGCVAAADRLAVGLCVAFLFAPAGRFGYFALPLLLVVWSRLATGALPGARSPAPLLRRGAPPTERPAALSRATPAPRRAPVAALHGRR